MTAEVQPAATILLLRDKPAFEVLLIERHADIGFAGGALVFPGGRVDRADHDPGWAAYCDGLDGLGEGEAAGRIAAIREAFEETGVLYAREDSGSLISGERALSFDAQRADVEAEAGRFFLLIREAGLKLALDALHVFAHWIPPEQATHKRFDTRFFAAEMPVGQDAREDGNEATEAIWLAPSAALAAKDRGERKMIFPTTRNVELLGVSNSVQAVFEFARSRKQEIVQPHLIERDGKQFIAIPDHLGYPVTEEPLELAMRA